MSGKITAAKLANYLTSKPTIYIRRFWGLVPFLKHKNRPLHLYCGPSGQSHPNDLTADKFVFYRRYGDKARKDDDSIIFEKCTSPLNGMSVNWSKFSEAADVVISGDRKNSQNYFPIPPSFFPIVVPLGNDVYKFWFVHKPEWDNYSHCQLMTSKNDEELPDYYDKVPKDVRLGFRREFMRKWNQSKRSPKLI